MDVLVDTNIILNFITGREDPYRVASDKIMTYAAKKYFHGLVAIHSLPTLWYVLRKAKSESETRQYLDEVCEILTVVSISHETAVKAIRNNKFRDFEDCLQDECAVAANAKYIVTCNTKDFSNAKTTVVSPDEFLHIITEILGRV